MWAFRAFKMQNSRCPVCLFLFILLYITSKIDAPRHTGLCNSMNLFFTSVMLS